MKNAYIKFILAAVIFGTLLRSHPDHDPVVLRLP